IKENHSFDNYFGEFPGANGATTGNSKTQKGMPLTPMSDAPVNCTHTWASAHRDIDGGKMDGFYDECGANAYVQAEPSLIPNYWAYAKTYGLADNLFGQMAGPSFPSHMYVFSENSGNAVDIPNVSGVLGWGCDAAAQGAVVKSINPATGAVYYQAPCFTMTTMGDVIDAAGVTWRIYSPQPGHGGYVFNFGSYYNNLWSGSQRANDVSGKQFCSDLTQGQLPQVSWITPPIGGSDHPPFSITDGENWTVQQVNCIMNSPYWSSTLILVVWDDWGGFYDHVAPSDAGFFGYGIRVPLLVISPYAKPGYIGHKLYSFDSINKEIETVFHVPCLLTDCSASVNDLSDMLTSTPSAPALVLVPRPSVKRKGPLVLDGIVQKDDDDQIELFSVLTPRRPPRPDNGYGAGLCRPAF